MIYSIYGIIVVWSLFRYGILMKITSNGICMIPSKDFDYISDQDSIEYIYKIVPYRLYCT